MYRRGSSSDRPGEAPAELCHGLGDLVGHLQRVGPGQLEDGDARARLAIQAEELAVGLSAQLDAADVPDAHDPAALSGRDLDDDVLELLDVVQPARDVDRELEALARGRGRHADLAGRHLRFCCWMALMTSLGSRPNACSMLGVQPDAHAVLADAEDDHIAHARQAREPVAQLDRGVVAQEQTVVAPSGELRVMICRMAVDFFLVTTPCCCTGGSWDMAAATRFCTSTCAKSRSVPTLKVTISL